MFISQLQTIGGNKLYSKQLAQLARPQPTIKVGGIMGRLYAESLTQVLVIHLLRHYSSFRQNITPENRNLTHVKLQEAIDYIHIHLNRDLSLAELASNVSAFVAPST